MNGADSHTENSADRPDRRRLETEAAGLRALLAAVEARDGYAGDHSRAVMGLAVDVAHRMRLSREEVDLIRDGALLYNVGKVSIPEAVLGKQGPLTEEEREQIRQHPVAGAQVLADTPGLSHLAPVIRATHERWDGTGYPDGLRGEEIPLASRVIHACVAWQAMASDRPYREALSVERMIEELKSNMGRQFDAQVVLALVEVLKTRHLLPPDETERMINEAIRLTRNPREDDPSDL
jgi:polar amino acid transport system substrate-binding protein